MPVGLLADGVLVLHLAFIAFALFGALLALRWVWAPAVHLPALAWAAWIELTSGICPLTPLENALRRAAGESGYDASFVEHYLVPLVYPPGLTPAAQLGLGAGLILLNGALYAYVAARRRAPARAGRPGWMTGAALFCLATVAFLVVRDLFVPGPRDVEVWLGFELRGAAARLTAPLHWAVFLAGAWAFWTGRPWALHAAAAYAFYVAASHLVWNLVSANGGGWAAGLVQAALFSLPGVLLLAIARSRGRRPSKA